MLLERTRSRVVALGVAVVAAVGVLTGCGGGDDDGTARAPEPTGAAADDQELVEGRAVFEENCAVCHGISGGGGRGPQLSEGTVADRYPDIEDQIEVITEGRGQMPTFDGELEADQIRAVARYEREVL